MASRITGSPTSRILGNDRPGPISTRLKDIYWRKHEEGWHHTPVRYLAAEAGE
jgi:branched-chain amino acid aminotransferase